MIIKTLEQWDIENQKLETFVDSIETRLRTLDETNHEFWEDLAKVRRVFVEQYQRKESEANLGELYRCIGNEKQRKVLKTIDREVYTGGSCAFFHHEYIMRLVSRGVFQILRDKGLVSVDKKAEFMRAMPSYQYHSSGEVTSEVLLCVFEREKTALE